MTKGNQTKRRAKQKSHFATYLKSNRYRSKLEKDNAIRLQQSGCDFAYEQLKLKYVIPARGATYTPDFVLPNGIIIETKGYLDTNDRKKMKLIKEQYPELDIRFVFSGNPEKKPIYKGSKTTYAEWCKQLGYPYASKVIPLKWTQEAPRSYLHRINLKKKEYKYDSKRMGA